MESTWSTFLATTQSWWFNSAHEDISSPAPKTEVENQSTYSEVTTYAYQQSTLTPNAGDNYGFADNWVKTLTIVIACTGIVVNGLVLVVAMTFTPMRKKLTNIYILNQTVIDFLACLFLLLPTVIPPMDIASMGWLGAELYCRLWLSRLPLWCVLLSSNYNLVALTLERYFKIVHPISHRIMFNKMKAALSIVFVWVIGVLYTTAFAVPSSGVVDKQCNLLMFWPSVAAQKAFGIIHVVINFFIPMFVLLYSYIHILIVLYRKIGPAVQVVAPAAAEGSNQANKNNSRRRSQINTIKTMISVSVSFFLCLVINQCIFLALNLGAPVDFTGAIYNISVLLGYINNIINPFIYTAQYRQFQQGLKKLFCRNEVEPASAHSVGHSAAPNVSNKTQATHSGQ